MKKTLSALCIFLCFSLLLACCGCSAASEKPFAGGTYYRVGPDGDIKQQTLKFFAETGRFNFGMPEFYSSYLYEGVYSVKNGILNATTADQKYTFRFEVTENGLRFSEQSSDPLKIDFIQIQDGTLFSLLPNEIETNAGGAIWKIK